MAQDVPLNEDLAEVSREVAVAIARCQAADAEKLAAYADLAEKGATIKATEKDAADLIAKFMVSGFAPPAPPVAEPIVDAPVAEVPAAEPETPVADVPAVEPEPDADAIEDEVPQIGENDE